MTRLTAKTLTTWRADTLKAQGDVCALCGEVFTIKNPAVADHNHTTGDMRAVLHRGCNAMLGVIENGLARYQLVSLPRLAKLLAGIPQYISQRRPDAPKYPTYRDAEAKRELRNSRARRLRAARSGK